MQYTEEQIAKANNTDLVSFLNAQGEQLVKSGREYRWKKHDSVTVSGNRWYRHSLGRGGYPVDFVMEFYNGIPFRFSSVVLPVRSEKIQDLSGLPLQSVLLYTAFSSSFPVCAADRLL